MQGIVHARDRACKGSCDKRGAGEAQSGDTASPLGTARSVYAGLTLSSWRMLYMRTRLSWEVAGGPLLAVPPAPSRRSFDLNRLIIASMLGFMQRPETPLPHFAGGRRSVLFVLS